MSPNLPLNRGRGVWVFDLGIAVLQPLDHSIGHHNSHPGIPGDPRNSRHHCGKGLMHLRCSSHCKQVSYFRRPFSKGAVQLTIHHSIPLHRVAVDCNHIGHGNRVHHLGSSRRYLVGGHSHRHNPPAVGGAGDGQTF